jgi:hypothetical protein
VSDAAWDPSFTAEGTAWMPARMGERVVVRAVPANPGWDLVRVPLPGKATLARAGAPACERAELRSVAASLDRDAWAVLRCDESLLLLRTRSQGPVETFDAPTAILRKRAR